MFTAAAAAAPTTTFSDGLGTRFRRMSAGPDEDVLELRRELLVVNSFEFAVRERVGRLSTFRHPSLAPVLRVERARDRRNSLAVVSAATDGMRLSTLIALSERGKAPIDALWAMRMVQQILDAAAALHQSDRDVVHGAIGPDRIIITSDGQAILADYALGSAIEQLRFSTRQYWTELGVSAHRTGRFAQRLDVRQTALVALGALLGRRLLDEEAMVDERAAHNAIASLSGPADRLSFVGDTKQWLRRALELDPPFSTARDACDALVELIERHGPFSSEIAVFHSAPAGLDTDSAIEHLVIDETEPAAASHVSSSMRHSTAIPAPTIESTASTIDSTEPTSESIGAISIDDLATDRVSTDAPPQPAPVAFSSLSGDSSAVAGAAPNRTGEVTTAVAAPVARSAKLSPATRSSAVARSASNAAAFLTVAKTWYPPVAAICVVVLMTTVTYLARRRPQPSPAPPLGTLTVATPRAGATVRIDQSDQGVTPLSVKLAAGDHVIELQQGADSRRVPVTVRAGVVTAEYVELSSAPPAVGALRVRTQPEGALVSIDGVAAGRSPIFLDKLIPGEHAVTITGGDFAPIRQTVVVERGATASIVVSRPPASAETFAGWIGITSPFAVEVFERGGLVGTSASPRLMLSAGTHQIELVNNSVGYRARRSVVVGAGKVTVIKIDAPTGTVSLNANPWATVWLDGEWLGETPIGNMPATVGTHQVVFRHPTLGEQRRTITVTVDRVVHLGVDFAKTRSVP